MRRFTTRMCSQACNGVKTIMNAKEFCSKVIGIPWVDHQANYTGADCYGLVYMFYRDVLNINIGLPESYANGVRMNEAEFSNGIHDTRWEEIERHEPGCVVLCGYRDGVPSHIGIVVDMINILHSTGSKSSHGSVKLNSVLSFKKAYGRVTFHRYKGTQHATNNHQERP